MIAATSFAGTSLSNSDLVEPAEVLDRRTGAWKMPGRSGPKPAWYLAFDAVSETEP